MSTQARSSQRFAEEVRQIRTGVLVVLAQWGLRSKFTRWRLTQDPGTGLVVLFGVLNHTDITEHTLTPFSDYFDPRLLLDLAMDLNVQVESSNSEGYRYAQLPPLITHNRSLAAVVAAPTILAQVEAEVERRQALYQPWPGNRKSLSEENAANLLKSRAELMLRIRLLLDEYDALASPPGEPERAPGEVTHSAGARREGARMGMRPNS